MPLSKNYFSYLDVKKVLDVALTRNGLVFLPDGALERPGRAQLWLQRARKFVLLARERGETKYDNLQFTRDPASCYVSVRPHSSIGGKILNLDGTEPALDLLEGDLAADAAAVRKELGLDE